MILLNLYIPKKSYSQERADRLAAEKLIYKARRESFDYRNPHSLCCNATIKTLHNPKAMENEFKTIRICTTCQTEAPKLEMFDDWDKIPKFFIDLKSHHTNNKPNEKQK